MDTRMGLVTGAVLAGVLAFGAQTGAAVVASRVPAVAAATQPTLTPTERERVEGERAAEYYRAGNNDGLSSDCRSGDNVEGAKAPQDPQTRKAYLQGYTDGRHFACSQR